jgi:hypothetical protein
MHLPQIFLSNSACHGESREASCGDLRWLISGDGRGGGEGGELGCICILLLFKNPNSWVYAEENLPANHHIIVAADLVQRRIT